MKNTENTFDLSTPGAKANILRWGGTCLSAFLLCIMCNVAVDSRTSISVLFYFVVIVIHVISSIVLIKGILSNNRRFVFGWLSFAAFNLILSTLIFFWVIFSFQLRSSFAFLAISHLIGTFFWLWTYSYYCRMPLVIDVMFGVAQVHM